MATLKTQPTSASVSAFIEGIENESRRNDCRTLLAMMKQATKCEPKMWGTSIIGFGEYHYCSSSGREGDWFKIGFSSRKASISVYLMPGIQQHHDLLEKLGKHSVGKGCLYIKSLSAVDLKVLNKMFINTIRHFPKQP